MDLIDTVLTWRGRLAALLVGADTDLTGAVRAVVALGGLQDCTVHFLDVPAEELRGRAVDAALATLSC